MDSSKLLVATVGDWIDVFIRHSMRDFFLHSRQHGLSITQIAALFQIRRKGTSSVSDIGDELQVTNPAASQLLERLVQQGLVARTEDPIDRRLKQIALTKRGESLLREGVQARQKWLEELAKSMQPDEQAQVVAALNILIERAQELESLASLEAE